MTGEKWMSDGNKMSYSREARMLSQQNSKTTAITNMERTDNRHDGGVIGKPLVFSVCSMWYLLCVLILLRTHG